MTHGDDDGLVLPPAIAPVHIALLPMLHRPESKEAILKFSQDIAKTLRGASFSGREVEVEIDTRDERGGIKLWSWIRKGVPLWIEIGPRELESGQLKIGRRDRLQEPSTAVSREHIQQRVVEALKELNQVLYHRAAAFSKSHVHEITTEQQLRDLFGAPNQKTVPGFALCHWCGDPEIEKRIGEELKLTVRCLPFAEKGQVGRCIFSGKESLQRVLIARAY